MEVPGFGGVYGGKSKRAVSTATDEGLGETSPEHDLSGAIMRSAR